MINGHYYVVARNHSLLEKFHIIKLIARDRFSLILSISSLGNVDLARDRFRLSYLVVLVFVLFEDKIRH